MKTVRVPVDFIQEILFIVDNLSVSVSLKVAKELMVVVSVAHSQIVVELHFLRFCFCFFEMLFAILAQRRQVPLMNQ